MTTAATTTRPAKPAAAPQQQPAPGQDLAALVDQMVAAMTPHVSVSAMSMALERLAPSIEKLLPPKMRGQGRWLASRAANYFENDKKLDQCPPHEFIRAVCRAAELGLAMDGRLCYCVKYKDAYQCVPDYKGLIAVARSAGVIRDCKAEVVKEHDGFSYVTGSGGDVLVHEPKTDGPRGKVIGAYARFVLPDGTVRIDYMTLEELLKVRAVSRTKNEPGRPWHDWEDEMYKKTPVKRGLKFFVADPTTQRVIDAAEEIEAMVSMESAGLDAPPVFADEPTPQAREQLEASFKAVCTQAKALGILDTAGYFKLAVKLGAPKTAKVAGLADADLEKLGTAIQAMIDTHDTSDGGQVFREPGAEG